MKWIRKSSLEPLALSMPGVKLGDRLLVVGCSDPMLIAGLGSKAGLTGRACAVDDDGALAAEAGRVAEREGALVETARAPSWQLPYEEHAFDVVVLRSRLPAPAAERETTVREAMRVLRPGGRCVAIEGSPRRGLSALVGGGQPAIVSAKEGTAALSAAGFVAVRTLAEREGMLFLEGVRRNR